MKHTIREFVTWVTPVILTAVAFAGLFQILAKANSIQENQEVIIHNQRVNTCIIRGLPNCGTPRDYR